MNQLKNMKSGVAGITAETFYTRSNSLLRHQSVRQQVPGKFDNIRTKVSHGLVEIRNKSGQITMKQKKKQSIRSPLLSNPFCSNYRI
jgi:hypothetical protein